MNDFVVFDVETPNSYNDKICSIGVTIIEEGEVISTHNYYINPECNFEERIIAIHGITESRVHNEPVFPAVWTGLRQLFLSRTVVAHNASFDLSVLKKTLFSYGIIEEQIVYVDTLELYKHFYPNMPSHRLQTLCDTFNIEVLNHDSGSDSSATAELLCRLIRDNIDFACFYHLYNLDEPVAVSHHRHLSSRSKGLTELIALLSEIVDDGTIELSEISELISWLAAHDELLGTYPYSAIFAKLYEIFEDQIITDVELQELFTLFNELINPVAKVHYAYDEITLTEKRICLSGEFAYGSKEEVATLLEMHGAIMVNSVSKKTDYVLVGEKGNSAWLTGNYGTKIKKAMELQTKGCGIKIIREEDLLSEKGVKGVG